ncbi:MAG: glycosyltransferase family 9 protein [Candidatus Obscuribacterales bacterium]|nr:glycosyltransferase family 9 protein [Candidatus Obscuribacterales bacterium]
MEILVVKLSAIGDVVHSLPAVNLLRNRVPGARITWVVEPLSKDLLLGNPVAEKVVVFEKKQIKSLSANAIKAFAGELNQTKYEYAIDFQGLFKSAAICRASGARKVFGFAEARELAPLMYTDRINTGDYNSYEKHIVLHNMRLANAVANAITGKKVDASDDQALASESRFTLPSIKDESIQKIEKLFSEQQASQNVAGAAHAPLVVLIPGTTWLTKLWPMPSWAALAEKLAARGFRVALIGGKGETQENKALAEEIRKASAEAVIINLTGKTSLVDLMALFSRAQLVIGGDTGPLHLAAAVCAPAIIGVYGSTPIGRNGPFGPHCSALSTSLECQPCFSDTCKIGTLACLKELSPEAVFEASIKALNA